MVEQRFKIVWIEGHPHITDGHRVILDFAYNTPFSYDYVDEIVEYLNRGSIGD